MFNFSANHMVVLCQEKVQIKYGVLSASPAVRIC